MDNQGSRNLARGLLVPLLLVSIFLAFQRQGLLPLISAIFCLAGLTATFFLQGRKIFYCLALVYGAVVLAWAATVYYVFSTWESGEVLEIQLNRDVTVRTWVVETGETEAVVYEAPPENLDLLQANDGVMLRRSNQQYPVSMKAQPVQQDSAEFLDIYALYEKKYAEQSAATTIYYLMIGPRRGSQLFILYFSRQAE